MQAPIGIPGPMGFDAAGNLYFIDRDANLVLKIDTAGVLTVVAGNGFRGSTGDGGRATEAQLNLPTGLAVAPDGKLYIAEYFNPRIRVVTPEGIIRAYAGTGVAGFSGDGGAALAARFQLLDGGSLALDEAGNLYVNDARNARIRRITPSGTISTYAGNGQPIYGGDGGPATAASFVSPFGIATDRTGNLYICDSSGRRVRKVDTTGIITTIAGTGQPGFAGDGGPATAALLQAPVSLAFDSAGAIYLLDAQRVRRIGTDGIIRTVAGSGGFGYTGDGRPAVNATFVFPCCVSVAPDDSLLVSDGENRRLRRVNAAGIIETYAGNGQYRFTPDGTPAALAVFDEPRRIFATRDGSLLVTDNGANRLLRVAPDGTVVNVAGTGFISPAEGVTGANLRAPTGLAQDAVGNIYFSEGINRIVRRIAPNGVITLFAGGGSNSPGDGGPATAAVMLEPRDIAIDPAGNVFITELNGHRVRRVAPNGVITTIAGTGTAGFSGDGGPGAQAQVNGPHGIAVDAAGNVYFAEQGNHIIRKVASDGRISTYAGNRRAGFAGDGGPALNASFREPNGIALDGEGNLYVCDRFNHRIRVITPAGIISTLAGTGVAGLSGDGGRADAARLSAPTGVSIDQLGNVYVADLGNTRLRVISNAPDARIEASPAALAFQASAGGASPTPQSVSLRAPIAGLPFSITTGEPWLRVSASGAVIPATLEVSADPAALAAGSYTGSITISTSAGLPDARINVTFTVEAGQPPRLQLDAAGVSISAVRGSAAQQRRLLVSNAGGGTARFTATGSTSTGGNWLGISPATGVATASTPVSITVTATAGALAPGTYSGKIEFNSPDSAAALSIPVTLTVSASGQSIRLTQTGLSFLAVSGGGISGPLNFSVVNTGQGSFPFTASASTLTGGSWLSVTPSNAVSDSSQSPPELSVTANHTSLAPGEYHGLIEIASPVADNSPQLVSVVLSVLADGSAAGPIVQPAGLVFTGVAGGPDPASQSILVTNLAAASIRFGSAPATLDGRNWLVYQPSAASVSTGSFRVVVQPSFAGLPAGTYRGAIALIFSDGSIRTAGILLVLAPTPPRNAAAGCTPTRLLPLITSLGSDFNIPAAFPSPVEAVVVDDCGDAHTNGSVSVSFSNGDPTLALVSLRNGRWSGTWANRNTTQRQVTVTAAAESSAAGIRGSVQISGGLSGNASPPIIGPGAIVSAASLAPQVALAPGSLVSLFGSRLAEGSAQAQALPLETLLAGTQVSVAGRRLPLLYSSDGQVNAILPRGIPVNTRLQLIVRRGNQLSVPEEIVVAPAQPAIFSRDGSGGGLGHIYIAGANGNLLPAIPSSPATAGQVIVVYAAGLGAVDIAVADNEAAPSSVLARTVEPVLLTIGGIRATVSFAGLAPGFTGLYQINAVVPAGVRAGGEVPVVLNISGQSSPAVFMAVR